MTNARKLKVLAVDDTPKNLMALQALLDDDTLELLTAESGPAALELLLEHDVAVALLDVQMPGMDGFALAELMRGTARTRHVPIIFVTAGGYEASRSFRGYEAGAVDFLFKPLDARILRSKVAVFVQLHRQRLELAERLAEQERLQALSLTMLSVLSHDIRAPLAALQLNAELLLRRGEEAGRRIKSATHLLSRQVDHLVNIARQPCDRVQLDVTRADLAELVRERLDDPLNAEITQRPVVLTAEGDGQVALDVARMTEVIDLLLMQAATHAGDSEILLHVDGQSRRSVLLTVRWPLPLGPAAGQHLFGSLEVPRDGVPAVRVGPGLDRLERVVRAHGGSLIGRSKEREGTLLELMLPRGMPD